MKLLLTILFSCAMIFGAAQAENDYINKGNDMYRQGRFNQAELQYRQALTVNQASETAKYNLANSLMQQKKYQEAQDIYGQLTTSPDAPLRSAAYYNTGVAYTKLKDLESSIEAYKDALRIKPDDKQARENLQKALSELKKQQSQSQSKSSSNMSSSQAEEKLKELQQKEREVQKRIQNQKKGQGGNASRDW